LTILLANDVFIQHYFTLYFLAIQIKKLSKSGSLVHTYACQLLGLMWFKPEGPKDDDKASSVFYVILLFMQAFSRVWFIGHFDWRMQPNPNFGKGTNGHLSPYCPEHTYVMSRDLEAMKNGRYKTHSAFAQYIRAPEKVPKGNNITQSGSAHFENFPSIFFETFCSILFNNSIVLLWHDEKHLVYIISGTLSLPPTSQHNCRDRQQCRQQIQPLCF
jgi:hypothetical protein